MIKRPADELIRKTQCVAKSLLRRGPAPTEELIEKICALGIRNDVILQWLSTFGQVRILGSVAIRWGGSLADKATVILEFQNEPMSRQRILGLLGPGYSIGAVTNFLSADERFNRFGPHLFGLSKWAGKEYHTLADSIEDLIQANGGEATLAQIISQILARTGASERSIRKNLATQPRFHRSDSGSYRVRHRTTHDENNRFVPAVDVLVTPPCQHE